MRGVGGMPFLPKELRCTQEGARSQFPAHDVRPLVDQQWQVAIRLNPIAEGFAYDRFRCGPDDKRLIQFLAAGMRDDRQFRTEAFDMLRFPPDVTLRNEEREIGVLVAGLLEAPVQARFYGFPDFIAVGLDDDATTHRAGRCQVGSINNFVVPARKIFALGGDSLFGHFCSSLFGDSPLIAQQSAMPWLGARYYSAVTLE